MFHCRCRALTELGEPFYFSAKDVPVKVYPDIFILAACPGTPLLKVSSMCRAMDHAQLAEGDRVLIEGKKYTLVYHKGFNFVSDSGIIIPSHIVSHYQLLYLDSGSKSKLQFKHGDRVFQLPSLFGCMGDKAVISVSPEPVDPAEIQISAGFIYKKEKVFYGDVVEGNEVIMWHGRPCVCKEGSYVEIPTGNLLGGVED